MSALDQTARPYGPHSARYRANGRFNTAAVGLSGACTLALFGLLLTLQAHPRFAEDARLTLVTIALPEIEPTHVERDAERTPDPAPDQAAQARPAGPRKQPARAQPRSPEPTPPAMSAPSFTLPTPISIDPPELSQPSQTPVNAPAPSDVAQGSPTAVAAPASGVGGEGSTGDGAGSSGRTLTAQWGPTMDFGALDRYFPREARGTGLTGTVALRCKALRRDRVRDCEVLGETPAGMGFGRAALKAQRRYRLRVFNAAGQRAYNEWVYFEAVFKARD